jgi:hypothetical protein
MKDLDRGVVAVKVTGGVYVGWRMLGYEYTGTDGDTSYNLYKDGTLVKNITDSTNYLDAAGTTSSKYTVSAVIKGTEGTKHLHAHARCDLPGAGELRAGKLQPAAAPGVPHQPEHGSSARAQHHLHREVDPMIHA